MSTLLRFAALPLSDVAQAASPGLFVRIGLLEERLSAFAQQAEELAEQIGTHLVVHDGLPKQGRRLALKVRRELHQGALAALDLLALADVAAPFTPSLAAWMRALASTAERIGNEQRELAQELAADENRLLALPWGLLQSTPAGRQVLRHAALSTDISARLSAGEPWTTKRMRQRSDYLWRLLRRGATRATPRGWLAHVTLLSIADDGAWSPGGVLPVTDVAATEVTENFEQARHGTSTVDTATMLTLAPLAWRSPEQIHVWQVQGDDPPRLVRVGLRGTPVMDAVWAAIHPGPQRAGELLSRLAGPDESAQEVLLRFLTHLAGIGVLRTSSPPSSVHVPWRALSAHRLRPEAPASDALRTGSPTSTRLTGAIAPRSQGSGVAEGGSRDDDPAEPRHTAFVDVYRRAAAVMATAHEKQLAADLGLALRLMSLTDLDGSNVRPPIPAALTPEPRPLLDIVADCVNGDVDPNGQAAHRHDWPLARDPESPYGQFISWLDVQLPDRANGTVIDISAAALDAFDAPEPEVEWPMDFLLRPVAGVPGLSAVLQDLAPAGLLDARFIPALTHFAGEPPHVAEYREFLRSLSALHGVPFVELLIPPLSALAANAVRRPGYTDLWTGDPDLAGYFPAPAESPREHIPLSSITLRSEDGKVVAETQGGRIWPITHSVRVPQAPWEVVRGLLLRASPQADRRQWRPLNYSLPAFPARRHVPRLTVGSGLTVSPAQWLVPRSELPDPADSTLRQARHLHRWRERLGLPRWVHFAADPHDEPAVADLESLSTLRAFAAVPAGTSPLLFTELLPAPGQLPVRAGPATSPTGHLAELLLRLPPHKLPAPAGNAATPR